MSSRNSFGILLVGTPNEAEWFLQLGNTLQDLCCRALSAGNCAVDGTVIAACIGGLAGEKQRVTKWGTESSLASLTSNFYVAVGAAGERVRVPVVEIKSSE